MVNVYRYVLNYLASVFIRYKDVAGLDCSMGYFFALQIAEA